MSFMRIVSTYSAVDNEYSSLSDILSSYLILFCLLKLHLDVQLNLQNQNSPLKPIKDEFLIHPHSSSRARIIIGILGILYNQIYGFWLTIWTKFWFIICTYILLNYVYFLKNIWTIIFIVIPQNSLADKSLVRGIIASCGSKMCRVSLEILETKKWLS